MDVVGVMSQHLVHHKGHIGLFAPVSDFVSLSSTLR